MAGTWSKLPEAPFAVGTMLLLTDGSVFSSEGMTPRWWRLTPDGNGEYGSDWTRTADLPPLSDTPYEPLDFASAVLADGTVFVAGGEYNGQSSALERPSDNVAAARLYDRTRNQWTVLSIPAGWKEIGDAPCCVLEDGTLLLGSIEGSGTSLFNPKSRHWSLGGAKRKNNTSDEETWTLLPDGSVLTIDCYGHPEAERYLPKDNGWVSAGRVVPDLVEDTSFEIGPALLLPDGRVLAAGATGATAFYTPPRDDPHGLGQWQPGRTFPAVNGHQLIAKDAPAALLPNGRVLFIVGYKPVGNEWPQVVYCVEYDPAADVMQLIDQPPNADARPDVTRLLLLPTGQVLLSNATSLVAIYTPDGAPLDAWRPRITSIPSTIAAGEPFTLTGQQLNGVSQAVSYGDDATMATNYPLVRLQRGDARWYCPTSCHSSMGVQTGTASATTQVTVPTRVPAGPAELVVVTNGIESEPVSVLVTKRVRAARPI